MVDEKKVIVQTIKLDGTVNQQFGPMEPWRAEKVKAKLDHDLPKHLRTRTIPAGEKTEPAEPTQAAPGEPDPISEEEDETGDVTFMDPKQSLVPPEEVVEDEEPPETTG